MHPALRLLVAPLKGVGGLPALPAGYVFLVLDDGSYVVTDDGSYIIVEA